MVSVYWRNDFDLAILLGNGLKNSENVALKEQATEYIVLSKLERGDIDAATAFLRTPTGQTLSSDSAENLYISARAEQKSGDYISAIQFASRILNEQSQLSEWVARAELMCLELYFQMEMPDSAKSVLDDIDPFYSDPVVLKEAAKIAAQKK